MGTVQGGSISPLLANIYLHYVFDLWVQRWRKKQAHGDVIVVRYADDFVVGFEHREEAERFLAELRERFAKFGLELHPDKTRLIEFGRYARPNRRARGEGKPETFNFLGFTHSCGKTRKGRFTVLRQTMRKRLQAKLQEVKAELRRRMHDPSRSKGAYLRSVVLGHVRYYGVPAERPGAAAPSVRQSAGSGGACCGAAARGTICPGSGCSALRRPLASARAHLPSLSARALRRHHPRQEPDAVMPLVRICGGGYERS